MDTPPEKDWIPLDSGQVQSGLGLVSSRISEHLNQVDHVHANRVGDHISLPQLVVWWSISRKKLHLGGDQWNSLSPPGWCLYTVHHRNHPPSWAKGSAKHSNNHPSYVPCRRRKGQMKCLLTWDQQSCGFACHYWWNCDSLLHRRVISSAMAVGQKRRLLRCW